MYIPAIATYKYIEKSPLYIREFKIPVPVVTGTAKCQMTSSAHRYNLKLEVLQRGGGDLKFVKTVKVKLVF